MNIIHKLTMDLARREIMPCIDVMQDDRYCRDLQIRLHANGREMHLPEDSLVLVRCRKGDGTHAVYDTLPDGTAAGSVSGSTVTVRLAPQVCTAPGKAELTVTLLRGEAQLSFFTIRLNVRGCPGQLKPSEDYIRIGGFLPQPETAAAGQYLRVGAVDEQGKVTRVEAAAAAGGSGTVDHALLQNRDAADQHPIGAVTGLAEALAEKVTRQQLEEALGQTAGGSGTGKSAYDYALEGGYTGTEAEFAEKLADTIPPLVGSTSTVTPAEAALALKAGRTLVLQHVDSNFGVLSCAGFSISETFGAILCSAIAVFNGVFMVMELMGDIASGVWSTWATQVPTALSQLENDMGYLTEALPQVTQAQNGAFLRVVDGVWAAVSAESAEEVAF